MVSGVGDDEVARHVDGQTGGIGELAAAAPEASKGSDGGALQTHAVDTVESWWGKETIGAVLASRKVKNKKIRVLEAWTTGLIQRQKILKSSTEMMIYRKTNFHHHFPSDTNIFQVTPT